MQAQIQDNPNNANAYNNAKVDNSRAEKWDHKEYSSVERKEKTKQKKKVVMTPEYATPSHQPPS